MPTVRPSWPPATRTTMTTVVGPKAIASRPNRRRRSRIGTTAPRKLITPKTCSGELGMRVTLSNPLISWTRRMSTPYSSPASINVKYCSLNPVATLSPPFPVVAVFMIPPSSARHTKTRTAHSVPSARQSRTHVPSQSPPLSLEDGVYQVRHVDDERHRSVAQNCCAGDTGHGLEIRLEALDHDLLLREQIVHQDSDAHAFRYDHDQEAALGGPAIRFHAELIPLRELGQEFIAYPEYVGASDQCIERVPRDLNGLDDGEQRYDVNLFADSDQLPVEDGQREGQPNANGAALALLGEDLHVAAQVVDIPAYHIHTDATTGDIADLFGRREARHEDQVVYLLVGQFLVHRHEPPLASSLQNPRFVEAGAVVAYFDDDVSAFVSGRKFQRAGLLLPAGEALLGSFQAVIQRVAHQVHEGIADLLEHGFVEFGAFSGQADFDLLTKLAGKLMHDSWESVECGADREHPNLHDAFLQLTGIAGKLRQPLAQSVKSTLVDTLGTAAQHRLRDEQLTD